MSATADRGRIVTVLGPIEPAAAGLVSPHEHLIIDFLTIGEDKVRSGHQSTWKADGGDHDPDCWCQPLSLRNHYEARRNQFHLRDTLRLSSVDDAVEALGDYRKAGGGTIVDVTSIDIGRDPKALREIARRSGVNVVMGAGYYVNNYHPAEIAHMDEHAICDLIVRDIEEGVDGIRPGIIGEVGLIWPIHDRERLVLRAAAMAQQATGLCLTIHPGRHPRAPLDSMRIVEEAGGDPHRTIVGHLDRTIFEIVDYLELANTGCYLELDLFGMESSFYPLADVDIPNDAMRVKTMRMLADRGHLDRLLISHDLSSRARLAKYGGEGYHHIASRILPLMARRGFSQDEIDRVVRHNPQRALTVA
ncbi:MAG: aryldialkylphosphatase [Alphaproteobacteria bacterium]|nr:MAG: aryldialkylphosphatase [Alphaproteobacteria bacterium]